MSLALRTLRYLEKYRIGIEAVCDTCSGRWQVNLRAAMTVLGDQASPGQVIGRAKCPRCCDGRAADWSPTIPTRAISNPVWFPKLFNDYNDDH